MVQVGDTYAERSVSASRSDAARLGAVVGEVVDGRPSCWEPVPHSPTDSFDLPTNDSTQITENIDIKSVTKVTGQ